jgi:CC2D2A N-terminal C2 domain
VELEPRLLVQGAIFVDDDPNGSFVSIKKSMKKQSSNSHLFPYDPEPVFKANAKYSVRSLKDDIKKRLHASSRPINSPVLFFTWDQNVTITDITDCPMDEQNRRRQLETVRYSLVISYNDRQVTATVPKPLDMNTFQINFYGIKDLALVDTTILESLSSSRSSFAIVVNEPPSSISVHIHEEGIYGNRTISKVYVPIPLPSDYVSAVDRQVNHVEFAGTDSSIFLASTSEVNIQGILRINAAWASDLSGRSLGPPSFEYYLVTSVTTR